MVQYDGLGEAQSIVFLGEHWDDLILDSVLGQIQIQMHPGLLKSDPRYANLRKLVLLAENNQ